VGVKVLFKNQYMSNIKGGNDCILKMALMVATTLEQRILTYTTGATTRISCRASICLQYRQEKHSGGFHFKLLASALDVLVPNWKYKLIGVATNGALAMTGSISGTHQCMVTQWRTVH
jgi:hypothetical protein